MKMKTESSATLFIEKIIKPLLSSIRKNCENNAFCIEGTFSTYSQLESRINAIRNGLQNVDENNVGLVANDDLDTYASILALWLEGKSYVPLHPGQPIERCLNIISQVGINTILDSGTESRYHEGHVVLTGQLESSQVQQGIKPTSDSSFAYILFTSGSTGKPKGVPVSRGNLSAFVEAVEKLGIRLNCDDRCMQMFDLTFDLSVQSYLLPLLAGACIYTIPYSSIKYQAAFEIIDEYHPTFALMVPSVIHYLRPYMEEIKDEELRYSLFCGEALESDDLAEWSNCVPNAQLWNVYGPTECTIYCTAYRIKAGEIKQKNGIVSIGKPMDGIATDIVDEAGKICSIDEKGELCLAGDQLTSGYWKNEENNRKAFFMMNGKRYYHTGDICSKDREGDILYYGRKDSQIKIQGYRIELSEIENVARDFFDRKNAVVALARKNEETDIFHIDLVVEGSGEDTRMGLLTHLKSRLPSYMLPDKIYYLERFPLNANNKIDRKKIGESIK